ncbi:uncharacterized protein EAE98_003212 [Botrytis deweyae]|uniref:Uncharacterized protein n=1 Tax=Botrytis deweyae TaxID=2478750 RepID=A0ABQ7IWS6_9HELO|nr:uncharacterized protein EAE98_003212 [Botrytis deweyae]KAF7935167.1 hypothetical protein EAE98_003212 [Botrytis deweyae]
MIEAYSDHFPNDTPFKPMEIHSRENWNRGLITLRAFWQQHKDGKVRQRNARSTPAAKPLWLNDEALKTNEIMELDDLSGGDDDDPYEERQEQNIAEMEALHRSLNTSGDIAKENVTRCKDPKKQTRKETPPEEMKEWIKELREKHDKYKVVSEPVKGPSTSDPEANHLITNAINGGEYPDELDEQVGKFAPEDWKSTLGIFQWRRCPPFAGNPLLNGPETECADKYMPELEKLALGLSPEEVLALKNAPDSDTDDDVMPALVSDSEDNVMPALEDENGNIAGGSGEKENDGGK